jgi:hypothetical protein
MPYVLTVDQRGSRHRPDRVPEALRRLAGRPVLRPFERTAGDEFQGILDDPDPVLDVVLDLLRDRDWSIGIGVGPVQGPLPAHSRAGRGPAFVLAREAVETAKRRPQHLAVVGADQVAGQDADAVLTLIATLVHRRSPQAWEAIDLVAGGLTQSEAADRLGISRQAIGQRLTAGSHEQVARALPAAARLLRAAGKMAR